jgi:hypothetical protein
MNYEKALDIFEIKNNSNTFLHLNNETLRKKYLKLSLLHHPDKNNNTNTSKEKFQEITEAYNLLLSISILDKEDEEEDFNSDFVQEQPRDFISILKLFINSLSVEQQIKDILINMFENKEKSTLEYLFISIIKIGLFNDNNKDIVNPIYNILNKYKNLLHIPCEILDKIRNLLYEDNFEYYSISPTLTDMFNNNIYKLEIENSMYFVPLWHAELFFEKTKKLNKNIIVNLIPQLPLGYEVDGENNIIITTSLTDLIAKNNKIIFENFINLEIGLSINPLLGNQTIIFENIGISKINENDIYDVEEKGNIIVKIIAN